MSAAFISVKLWHLNIGANSVVGILWIKESTEDIVMVSGRMTL